MGKPIAMFLVLAAAAFYFFVPGRSIAPTGDIAWRTDAETALSESAPGRPTLIVFTASWCGPCKQMKSKTWPDPAVARAAKRYHAIWADIDNQPAVARKFDVQTIPTVITLDASGAVRSRTTGFTPASEMAARLER